jgi:hypothetical protein
MHAAGLTAAERGRHRPEEFAALIARADRPRLGLLAVSAGRAEWVICALKSDLAVMRERCSRARSLFLGWSRVAASPRRALV